MQPNIHFPKTPHPNLANIISKHLHCITNSRVHPGGRCRDAFKIFAFNFKRHLKKPQDTLVYFQLQKEDSLSGMLVTFVFRGNIFMFKFWYCFGLLSLIPKLFCYSSLDDGSFFELKMESYLFCLFFDRL